MVAAMVLIDFDFDLTLHTASFDFYLDLVSRFAISRDEWYLLVRVMYETLQIFFSSTVPVVH